MITSILYNRVNQHVDQQLDATAIWHLRDSLVQFWQICDWQTSYICRGNSAGPSLKILSSKLDHSPVWKNCWERPWQWPWTWKRRKKGEPAPWMLDGVQQGVPHGHPGTTGTCWRLGAELLEEAMTWHEALMCLRRFPGQGQPIACYIPWMIIIDDVS